MFTGNCEFLSWDLILFHGLEVEISARGAIGRAGFDMES